MIPADVELNIIVGSRDIPNNTREMRHDSRVLKLYFPQDTCLIIL